METTTIITGNLTANPEIRYTATGTPVANFIVASSSRVYDKDAGEWKDGDTVFLRCTAWKALAERVADELTKGQRVLVVGRLKQRQYENDSGQKTIFTELVVDEIGASIRFAKRTSQGAGFGNLSSLGGEETPPF